MKIIVLAISLICTFSFSVSASEISTYGDHQFERFGSKIIIVSKIDLFDNSVLNSKISINNKYRNARGTNYISEISLFCGNGYTGGVNKVHMSYTPQIEYYSGSLISRVEHYSQSKYDVKFNDGTTYKVDDSKNENRFIEDLKTKDSVVIRYYYSYKNKVGGSVKFYLQGADEAINKFQKICSEIK